MSDLLANLYLGFGVAFTPYNLMFCMLGALVGTLAARALSGGDETTTSTLTRTTTVTTTSPRTTQL